MCLDVKQNGTTNGTLVDLFTCNGGQSQQWQAKGKTLVGGQSGLCLDDPHSSTVNGTQLDIWNCNGGANQVWNVPASTPATKAATAGTQQRLQHHVLTGAYAGRFRR